MTREEWLRLAAQGSQLGLWYWNQVTQKLFCDRRTREMYAMNLEGDVTLDDFFRALHPDDVARVQQVWRHEFEVGLPYELEYRARWPDGSVRWVHDRGSGFYDKSGKPLYMIGVVFDITERKESERERVQLSGRLINAQERERKRLAREIHDDFCQRFAVLTLKLQALNDSITDAAARSTLRGLIETFGELGSDVQNFSHRLHSSRLDVLGLVPSIESLCAEFSRDHELQVEFERTELPLQLPPDISLCLFRVAQEALHNVVKHSDASSVEVRLDADAESVALTIFDDGKGLDAAAARVSSGIGVESMKERARMCGGQFQIRSRPAVPGTRIDVIIPLTGDAMSS